MLGVLFLAASLIDPEPAKQQSTYALLLSYLVFASAVAIATWRNWWLDARLALPTHLVDMAMFTAIVFSINGYTSPFFLFFVLPLSAATVRWSWRETALTAGALIALYLAAAYLVAGTGTFELQRVIVRSGHLVILSLLLIWFGVHQRFTRLFFRIDEFEARLGSQDDPGEAALAFAMKVAGAPAGVLLLNRSGGDRFEGPRITGAGVMTARIDRPLVRDPAFSAFLCDVPRDRALTRQPERRARFARAAEVIDIDAARQIGLDEGLIAEVRSGTDSGWLVLWGIADLSVDYVDFGRELGRAVGAILDRHALVSAIEISAAANTRLSIARDVHDSIVQFLAGAAIRIEAIKRAAKSGRNVASELDDLKRLLVEEQDEIRGFIHALRRARELELGESVEELRGLAKRLGDQWSVACDVRARDDTASIPIRLQLDLQHLLREAVANAVRHGGADRIDVDIAVDDGVLRLSFADNGSGFDGGTRCVPQEPRSLKERVERAHGSLRLDSRPGSTTISVELPLAGTSA